MKRILLITAIILSAATQANAQGQPDYRMEVGAGGGLTGYLGDLNGTLMHHQQFMGAAVAKYRLNPRMAWAMQLGYGQLKGDNKLTVAETDPLTGTTNVNEQTLSFKSSLIDWHVRFEYNFWPYGTGREYYGAQPLTPFIAFGLGLAFAKPDNGSQAVGGQMPIGLGIKYKVAERLNLTAEWMLHFTGSDKLDGLKDPYGIKSSGLFKNTDCYSVLQLSLTYDFWERCKACHNDKD